MKSNQFCCIIKTNLSLVCLIIDVSFFKRHFHVVFKVLIIDASFFKRHFHVVVKGSTLSWIIYLEILTGM